ncbi:hypothetical protein Tsubulata_049229 [Turnera subulata]|uniref:Uncharacterized protein n=1 Tax=Turnera subulata TaxID=218843 RepID=A0A9Q0FTX7_9ROSI|nr:hypothetical protein Tsubulata_049229 [Turnera subulata]
MGIAELQSDRRRGPVKSYQRSTTVVSVGTLEQFGSLENGATVGLDAPRSSGDKLLSCNAVRSFSHHHAVAGDGLEDTEVERCRRDAMGDPHVQCCRTRFFKEERPSSPVRTTTGHR